MLRKIFLWLAAFFALPALALDGEVIVHDPSTIIFHGGRYYTYGTGTGLPILTSEDGWTWKRSGTLMSAVSVPEELRRARPIWRITISSITSSTWLRSPTSTGCST